MVLSLLPLCALLALADPAPSAAALSQDEPGRPTRTAVVTTVSGPILVDGVLDEPAWETSPGIGNLIQRIPTAGVAPSERTEVTLLRDADNLYIGVMCHDSEPDGILASQMARDAALRSDDYVELLLDTFRDQSNAFYFATNPNGALVDGLVFANGETNEDWDAIWTVETARSDQGWSAEFAIPLQEPQLPPGRHGLGIQHQPEHPAEVRGGALGRAPASTRSSSRSRRRARSPASAAWSRASAWTSGRSSPGAGTTAPAAATTVCAASPDSTCSTT